MRIANVFLVLGLAALGYSGWEAYRAESEYREQQLRRSAAPKVYPAPADRIDPSLEGKLVHVTAPATADAPVRDPDFEISVPALRLERQVHQYTARVREVRHSKHTSRERRMEWSLVSGPNGKLCSKDFFPERVQIGALSVSPEDHYLKNNPAQVVLRPEQVKVPPGACWVGNVLYLDGRPKDPMENDLRVVFRIFPPMTLSAIGIQKGARLEPRPGTAQLWMHKGSVSIADYVRSHQRPLPPPSFGRQETMRWALLGTMLLVISGLLKQFKIRKDWEYPSLSGAGRTQSD